MQLADSQRKVHENDSLIKTLHAVLRAHELQHHCEALYAQGRIHDAAKSLTEISITGNNEVRSNMRIIDWVTGEFCVEGYDRVYSTPSIRV